MCFQFIAPVGLSTESEASAADVASIIGQVRQLKARAIFVENALDPRLIEQIARESTTSVAGKLYADALFNSDQNAGSYIQMMRHNLSSLVNALQQ